MTAAALPVATTRFPAGNHLDRGLRERAVVSPRVGDDPPRLDLEVAVDVVALDFAAQQQLKGGVGRVERVAAQLEVLAEDPREKLVIPREVEAELAALELMLARPAMSETSILMSRPTSVGSVCW